MVAAGTISASACNNFGRSDCTPRDVNPYSYSYGYGGYFEDSAIAGYYASSPGYSLYPPTPVYGYAPPAAYGYYPAAVYGSGYCRSYYRAPAYGYREVGSRRW